MWKQLDVISLLTKSVQELDAKNKQYEQNEKTLLDKINELSLKLNDLTKRIEILENK